MFRGRPSGTITPVIIHLRIEGRDPPRGQLWSDGAAPRPFTGWLDLLRLLSELLAGPSPP